VGPEPASVYWKRRAVVLGGLVVVIVILIFIIKALAGGGREAAPPASPPPKSPTAPPPAPQAPPVEACADQQLAGGGLAQGADILLTKDKASYGPGEPVTLKAQVKNTGTKDCELLNNPYNVVLTVFSGTDRIFSSSDCAAQTAVDAGQAIVIKAGETAEIPISWEPTRSQQGCPETAETPGRGKDATYRATATIMGVASDETQFLLTP
jgi:hypothetical protein